MGNKIHVGTVSTMFTLTTVYIAGDLLSLWYTFDYLLGPDSELPHIAHAKEVVNVIGYFTFSANARQFILSGPVRHTDIECIGDLGRLYHPLVRGSDQLRGWLHDGIPGVQPLFVNGLDDGWRSSMCL